LRPYFFAKYWKKMGNNITILTAEKRSSGVDLDFPIHNFEVITAPFINIIHEGGEILKKLFKYTDHVRSQVSEISPEEQVNSNNSFSYVNIKKAWLRFARKRGLFVTARIPDIYDLWAYSAVKKGHELLKTKSYDWIVSSYGPPASHIAAGILSKTYQCRWVADYRDLWIENHIYRGMWPFTIFEKYMEKKYVGHHANVITTVSEPLANILRRKFNNPVFVIENGYDDEEYDVESPPYFSDQKIRIIYTGNIYPEKRNPSPLFAAIADLATKDTNMRQRMSDQFEVLFFGNENDWLNQLIIKYGVQSWVKYMGKVNRIDALRIQKQADLLLFLEWGDESVDGILTGKLFEYLAARKPIIGIGISPSSAAGILMCQAGVGQAVGEDLDKVTSILRKLITENKPFVIQPREEVINKYTRRKQAEFLLHIMNKYSVISG